MSFPNLFPGWEIIEKIGSGGFSTVYKIKKIDLIEPLKSVE